MGEIAGAFVPCQQRFILSETHIRKKASQLRGTVMAMKSAQMKKDNISTFSSRISTDLPLYEVNGASFDRYLEDRGRVFNAIFPDRKRSQRLNDDEWRIQMLPIDFLFLTAKPVIDMRLRCKDQGKAYPIGVPLHITKVLELEAIRWELQGLDNVLRPSYFSLGVKGILYPDRQGIRKRLKGQLEMSVSCVLPSALSILPQDMTKSVVESILKRLVENMKKQVNESLLSDFRSYVREQPRREGHSILQQPGSATNQFRRAQA